MDFVTDYPFIDGLLESTDEDKALFDVLMGGAVPLTALWQNDNDDAKIIQWDASLEKYLQHRREILDYEGRLSNLPFSIYETLNVDWIDGYNYSQGGIGNCQIFGTKVLTNEGLIAGDSLIGRSDVKFFSFDTAKEEVVMRDGYAYDCGLQECVRITIETGCGGANPKRLTTFTHGAAHPVMCTDGKMVDAQDLKIGMSVVTNAVWVDSLGYACVHSQTKSGKTRKPKRFNSIISPAGELHHIDRNKLNNRFDNLITGLTKSEHRKLHANDDNSLTNRRVHAKTTESRNENTKRKLLERFYQCYNQTLADDETSILQEWTSDREYQRTKTMTAENIRNHRKKEIRKNIEKHFGSYEGLRCAALAGNGRVVKVEKIGLFRCFDIAIEHADSDDRRDWTQHNYYQGDETASQHSGTLLCVKNCTGNAHKNALKASNLVNQKRTGRKAPEIYLPMTYALARGNGRVRNGSGLNLNPMQKWAADVGNFLTADFGGYDEGRRVHNPTDTELKNARSHQSIIIPLPDTDFDTVFSVVSAGFGVAIGTSLYPVASQVNSAGIAIPSSWKRGNHATSATGAFSENGVEYIWWENSHGNSRYKVGKFGHGSGCAMRRADWNRLEGDGFRFGNWYATAGELPR